MSQPQPQPQSATPANSNPAPPASQPGNSLVNRLTNRLAGNNQPAQQANASTPANAPGATPATPASNNSPFGTSQRPAAPARPGAAPANNNAPAPAAAPPRFGSGPFQNANQRTWTMQPLQKTVVRFELRGLGDPFYRLLGHDLNPEFGDFKHVTAVLEKGSESVKVLEESLNNVWDSYRLQGAILVYNWNADAWKTISALPAPAPAPQ
ncbi:MAG TPA: hypothetical protein VHL11_22840, partial [Phototrophicaceae bacterium]|nr:hypothetical protein [Phototrophicaceae bacterium]